MADEVEQWDGFEEFLRSDFGIDWSAEGHDMQGVGIGEE